jgi:hypothetical protein
MTTPDAPMDPRLGRRPGVFAPENLNYLSRPLLNARRVERKDTFWRLPGYGSWPLDQLNTPECTGFGSAHELAAGPIVVPGVDAALAHQLYVRNVEEDRKAGRFFSGGATVQATMRALHVDGRITGYVWNLGLDDTIDALCAVGPQILGTTWKTGMFDPTPDGLLRVTGADAGGHLWVLVARVERHPRWGPGCWMLNSWGPWGVGVSELGLTTGCAFIRDPDLAILLADGGESVAPTDLYIAPPPVTYVARRKSRVFHRLSCWNAPKTNRREFTTYADAVADGLRPCRLCRP